MSLHYTYDGIVYEGLICGVRGEPRGPASALPAGWVCVVVDGRLMHLCLACEKARRGEPK